MQQLRGEGGVQAQPQGLYRTHIKGKAVREGDVMEEQKTPLEKGFLEPAEAERIQNKSEIGTMGGAINALGELLNDTAVRAKNIGTLLDTAKAKAAAIKEERGKLIAALETYGPDEEVSPETIRLYNHMKEEMLEFEAEQAAIETELAQVEEFFSGTEAEREEGLKATIATMGGNAKQLEESFAKNESTRAEWEALKKSLGFPVNEPMPWKKLKNQDLLYVIQSLLKTMLLLEEADKNRYLPMLHGPILNKFALMRATPERPGDAVVDKLTGVARIQRDGLALTIDGFMELTRGLTDTAHMLFDALLMKFTEGPPADKVIELPLREYMDKRGLKDEKEARKQVKEDLEAIRNCYVDGPKGYMKKGEGLQAYFFGGLKGILNSVITFSVSDGFYKLLLEYPVALYPETMLKIDTKNYKHAYPLCRYIYDMKRINAGKGHEDIYSIKALLAACPSLPRYEELDKSKGEISRKIIEPFLNNLNHLEDMGLFAWTFCHSHGAALSLEEEEQAELEGIPYSLFETLNIKITFKAYPSQEKRIAARIKRITAVKKAEEKAEKKLLDKTAEAKVTKKAASTKKPK